MTVLMNYIPETLLLLTIVISSLLMIKQDWMKKHTTIANIIFVLGMVICGSFLIGNIAQQESELLKNIFKLYFVISSIFYILIYSRRFHIIERIATATICLGLFLIVSSTDPLMTFTSFALVLASLYSLALTRERPSKDAVTFLSILLIVSLLYAHAPFFASIIMLIATVFFCLKTTNKDLEAVIVTLVLPAILYMLIRELMLTKDSAFFIENSLTSIGLALMTIPALLMIANVNKNKNMVKLAIFYLGTILFMIGTGSIDIKATAVIMILLYSFIYSPERNPITILALSLLPPMTTFIAKIPMFWAPLKTTYLAQIILIAAVSLVITLCSALELYRYYTSGNAKKEKPVTIKIISVAAIIVSVIYFDHIKITLEYALKTLGK